MVIDLVASTDADTHCEPIEYNRTNHITVLAPDSYENLPDKPAINGITLSKDSTAASLNLLSSKEADYEKEISLDEQEDNGEGSLIVLNDNAQPARLPLKNLTDRGVGFFTREELDQALAVGSYQFVEKKEDVNGG